MCIHLMQQILHKFGVDCEFVIPTVMVFQLRAEDDLCGVKLFCWCAVGFLFVCFLLCLVVVIGGSGGRRRRRVGECIKKALF